MRLTSPGDLGRSFGLSQAYAKTKQRLDRLTAESSSGLRSDVAASTRGDTRPLAGIDNRLRRLDAFDQAAIETANHLDTAQTALTSIRSLMSGNGIKLMSVNTVGAGLDAMLVSADGNLEAALGYLNVESAGRFAFSGANANAPATVQREALMGQIDSLIAGLTSTTSVVAAVSNFFDAPAGGGGYLDQALTGSANTAGAVTVGAGSTASNPITAADPAIREVLKGLVLAAVAQRGLPGGDGSERIQIAHAAGQAMITADDKVVAAAARLGVVQERIEAAQSRNAAERSSLSIARNAIVAVDPYETATALAETETRLDTLYALTARLSRLSLADRL